MIQIKKAASTDIRYKSISDRVRIFKMFDCKGRSFAVDSLENSSGVTVNEAIDLCFTFGKRPASVFALISFDGVKNETSSFILNSMKFDFRMIDVENDCFLDDNRQSDLIRFEEVLKILDLQKNSIGEDRLVNLMMKSTGLSDEACARFLTDTVNEPVFDCAVVNDSWIYKISDVGQEQLHAERTRITGAAARKINAEMLLEIGP